LFVTYKYALPFVVKYMASDNVVVKALCCKPQGSRFETRKREDFYQFT
jgi:hypothetical protein